MATASDLLRKFLAVLKFLVLAAKRLAKETRVRLLRQAALLWKLFRSRVVPVGLHRKGKKTPTTLGCDKPQRQPHPPNTTRTTTIQLSEKPATTSTHIPTTTTTATTLDTGQKMTVTTLMDSTTTLIDHSTNTKEIIPLDSTISCSLHPYPYLNHSASRASLQEGLHAARSAHSVAVSSRNASRSSQNLVSRSPDTQSLNQDDRDHGGGYTIEVETPRSPSSPYRKWSQSSPHLGGPGHAHHGFGIELQRRTAASSPVDSIEAANPAGVVPSVDHSVHEPQLSHERIFPIAPEYFQRYDRPKFVEPKETTVTLKPMMRDYRDVNDPPGWMSIVHPEGLRYFYNKEKKAVTDANLYDRVYYDQIMEDISTLEEHIQTNRIQLPENYTLAMDLTMLESGRILTDYYYADHDKKIVLFLDELDAGTNLPAWAQIKGVTSFAHIHHEIEAQYWTHGMYYPNTVVLDDELVASLRDIVLHYIGDLTTSPYSTSPYNLSELNQMLSQLNSLKKNVGYRSLGASSLFCRMMFVFARQRFLHWHSVPEARLFRDQSVHGAKIRHKTLLIKLLSPILFSAPDVHLKSLEKMWVDKIMHGPVWLESIKKLNEEWQEFILYATVLLNANVGFLAIESVDIEEPIYRSPTQVACYLSIVASIGSIILGLLLMRQNRRQTHGTADDAWKFLKDRSHPTLGLETLAILYSLPYALLLWGMVSFLAAFAWNCFDNSSLATRMIMAIAWFAFAVLVLWCTWMGWTRTDSDSKANAAAESSTEEDGQESNSMVEKGGSVKVPSVHSHARRAAGRSRPGSALSVPTRPASRASVVSSVPRLGSMPAGENARVGTGGGGGVIQAFIGPLWKWPARFFHLRRESYDSQRTVV